jgi:hypothetical protein
MFNLGVLVQGYHTDNGTFNTKAFMKIIKDNYQTIAFSGNGAHHQNGRTERAIGTVFSIARTMLIHGALRWPVA